MAASDHLYYPGGVHHASINVNASGDTALVALVAGKRIVVLSYHFLCAAANTVSFKSASTVICGPQSHAANGGIANNHNPIGWFMTAAGEALNINLGSAQQVGGSFVYQVIE